MSLALARPSVLPAPFPASPAVRTLAHMDGLDASDEALYLRDDETGYYWSPTPLMGRYELVRLEEPPFDAEAWKTLTDADNPNPQPTRSLASKLSIGVSTPFQKQYPHLAEFFSKVDLPIDPLNKALAQMSEQHSTPRQAAEHAFARLRTWDTDANNGVLIYLLLADHRIEIVADRGLTGRVEDAEWSRVCRLIEQEMRAGHPEQAVIEGIRAVSELLAVHWPQSDAHPDEDELPNRPHLLD